MKTKITKQSASDSSLKNDEVPGLRKRTSSNGKRPKLQGKNIFLTFPKSFVTKEATLKSIKSLFGEKLESAIVAAEKHKDGTEHLHCVVSLNIVKHQVYFSQLDKITGKRGNYQLVRDLKAVIQYVTKDSSYVTFPEGLDKDQYIQEYCKAKKEKISDYIAKQIISGKTIHELYKEEP